MYTALAAEDEGTLGLHLQLFAVEGIISVVALEEFVEGVLVEHAEVGVQGSLALEARLSNEVGIHDVGFVGPTLFHLRHTECAVAEEFEVVQRVAVEDAASGAALEAEAAVDVDESSQEFQFDAGVADEVVRVGQSAAEHTADAGVDDVEVMVPETEVDMNTELGSQVGVELSLAVPSVVSHASVGSLGAYGISQFADADVEACIDTQAAVEDTQVDIDVAVDLGTHHESASRSGVGSEHLLRGLARLLCLVDVGTFHAALALAVEEVGDVGRYGRQLAVVGQFVADAEVHVGSYLDADDA